MAIPDRESKDARRKALSWAVVTVAAWMAASPAWAEDYGSATVDRVTSIYDGDTFRADLSGAHGEPWPDIAGRRVPIRVGGADTPEMRADCEAEKVSARRAKQFTVSALRNAGSIRLDHIERGKYFRIVADVMVDGRNLGKDLIEHGLAVPYKGGHKENPWCQ